MFRPEFLCLWRVIDYSHQILLGLCIYIFGFISILLNIWVTYAFIKSRLLTFKSHILLLSFCTASVTKATLTGFLFTGTSALAGRWLFGTSTCHLFAFLRQMLGVLQIMTLVFISFERYFVNRPRRRDLPTWFYISGITFSWILAVGFSLPPLFGYGSYNCDVTGTVCELDWRNLTPRQVGFNVFYLVFVGVLPVCLIFACFWKIHCSTYHRVENKVFNQISFTKTMTIMIITIYLFWIPHGILTMWIFLQNLHPPRGIPIALTVIAPISNEAAEIIPILCYLTYDIRLRSGLLEICEHLKSKHTSKRNIFPTK